jgi:phosphonate transport system ATP-binding protein
VLLRVGMIDDAQSVPTSKSSAEAPLFRLHDVQRKWGGVEALRGVTLDIRAGETILLAGPSGSGKSTLLKILTGALKPTTGRIEVNGADIAKMTPSELRKHKRNCGIVEQGNMLIPQLDVHHNVVAGCIGGWPWHRVLLSAFYPLERERVAALLADLGIGSRQWDITGNLSGGQQQRVAVARAMMCRPSLIIADEPTASLDKEKAIQVTKMLVAAAQKSKATLILCTHWVSLALPFMERFIGLRDGQVTVDCHARDYNDHEFVDQDSVHELYEGSLEAL